MTIKLWSASDAETKENRCALSQNHLVQSVQAYKQWHTNTIKCAYAGMYPSLNCCSSFLTSSAFLLAFIASLILSFSAAVMSLPEAPGVIDFATTDTSDSLV